MKTNRFDKIAPIIFFTSSSEFALQSYSVNAINYVLKPISREKLFWPLIRNGIWLFRWRVNRCKV